MSDLFSISSKINIVELTKEDVVRKTDIYTLAFELIRKHEEKYPDIERWFKTKVSPGIINNSRSAFIGFDNNTPVATSIVKKGEVSKFCHLHIDEELRHQSIGDVFFMLMSMYVRRYAKSVYFSLPEGLWEEKRNFFNSFGFQNVRKCPTQYRTFEEELIASTDMNTLWHNTLSKLPELTRRFNPTINNPLNGIVMSILPKYSNQILSGEKRVEIRKKFNTKWKNHIVNIYSSSPVQQLVGYATIKEVIEDDPITIWNLYSGELGCLKEEFETYTKGFSKVFAIVLENVNKYEADLSLRDLSEMFKKEIHPPQSYSSVSNTEWRNAVSIAEILNGRLSIMSDIDDSQPTINYF